MTRHRLLLPTALALGCLAIPAAAAEDEAPLQIHVRSVTGTVETRPAAGQPWRAVRAGMTLKTGADLRTGFRARCILDMTDSLVQVDPLTVVRIAELQRTGRTVRTRLHMKQGHTQAVVEKGRIESDFAILTPSAALSVRGTRGINCRYFPDKGGTYGLAERGLIAIIDGVTGHEADVRPGQETDDRATRASEYLADRYVPIAMDQAGHEKTEKRAARRWKRSVPTGIHPAEARTGRRVQEIANTTSSGDLRLLETIEAEACGTVSEESNLLLSDGSTSGTISSGTDPLVSIGN